MSSRRSRRKPRKVHDGGPGRRAAHHRPRGGVGGGQAVVLAVPSQSLRGNLTAWRGLLPSDAILVSLAKGVELGTLKRMSEVIAEIAVVSDGEVVVVSGPNLAREIAQGQPAAAGPPRPAQPPRV